MREYFVDVQKYVMFGEDNDLYNAFFVSSVGDWVDCYTGCRDIGRLLCCNVAKAHEVVLNKCGLPQSPTLQTVILHNDDVYAGAGYGSSNVATSTFHASGLRVAVHELGHSMFDLADEYSSGWGTSDRPNCDSQGCNKWNDLQQSHGVDCVENMCNNNNYFASEEGGSFMKYLGSPVGHVNARYMCCTYMFISGGQVASFCDTYDTPPGHLNNFCDLNHQGYNINRRKQRRLGEPSTEEEDRNGYVSVQDPELFVFQLALGNGLDVEDEYKFSRSFAEKSPSHRIRQVRGDYPTIQDAKEDGVDEIVSVSIQRESIADDGSSIVCEDVHLIFDRLVEVFPPPPENEQDEEVEEAVGGGHIKVVAPEIAVVMERMRGCEVVSAEATIFTTNYLEE